MAQANTVGVVSVNEAGTALVTTNENKNLLTVDPTAKTVPTTVVVDTYNVKNVLTQSGKTYTTVKEVTNTLTTVVKEPVMVQKVEDGKPVVDGDGNPVMVQKVDENGDPVFVDKTVPVEHAGVVMSGIVSISAGAHTSAAVRNDGTVYIWGRNDNYETASGDEDYVFEINEEETHIVTAGNENHVYQPVLLTDGEGAVITDVSYVSLGASHGVAVKKDGSAWAWGLNTSGQTGIGADPSTGSLTSIGDADSPYRKVKKPEQVRKGESWNAGAEPSFLGAAAVDAGYTHTLAVRNDGTVFSWGSNENYKLGAATVYEDTTVTTTTRIAATPVQVGDIEARTLAIVKVTVYTDATKATVSHTYQFDPNNLSAGLDNNTDTVVSGTIGDTIAQISMMEGQVAVIDYSNNAATNTLVETYLSGFNLKVNSRSMAVRPVDVTKGGIQWTSADPTVATVAAMGNVATISTVENKYGTTQVRATNNISGHTGTLNVTVTQRPEGVSPVGTMASTVVTGRNFSAALRSDGTVWAWGLNNKGQLGDGTLVTRTTPTQVQIAPNPETPDHIQYLRDVVAIAAGEEHLVLLTRDGVVYTTGDNTYGQLGYGSTANEEDAAAPYKNNYAVPVRFRDADSELEEPFIMAIAAGSYHTLALTRGVEVIGSDGVAASTGGEVWAWGDNRNYQVGQGTSVGTEFIGKPVQVLKGQSASDTDYLGSVAAITAGQYNSFAIRTDGFVFGWGRNDNGQLGDGTTENRGMPVYMLKGQSGSYNDYLDNGFGLTAGSGYMENAYMVSAGLNHTLVLVRVESRDGSKGVRTEVYATGDNTYGQLGTWTDDATSGAIKDLNNRPAYEGSTTVPMRVLYDPSLSAPHNWFGSTADAHPSNIELVGVMAGEYHSFALDKDGKLYAWGRNAYGQLGVTDTEDTKVASSGFILPVPVLSGLSVTPEPGVDNDLQISSIRSFTGRFNHTIALKDDGTVWGWGENNYWKLGANETTRVAGDNNRYLNNTSVDRTHVYPIRVGEVEHTLMLVNDQSRIHIGSGDGTTLMGTTVGSEIIRIRDDQTAILKLEDVKKQYLSGFDLYDRNGEQVKLDGLDSATKLTVKIGDELIAKATSDDTQIIFWPAELDSVEGRTMGHTTVEISYTEPGENGRSYLMLLQLYVSRKESPVVEQRNRADVTAPMISVGGSDNYNSGDYNQNLLAHSASLKADGTVWTWGYGGYGQLGEGTTNSFTFPVQVKRGDQEVYYYCPHCDVLFAESAFGEDGTLTHVCPAQGNLETTLYKEEMESTGEYLHHIVSVSAGQTYTLALDMWGNVWAWGTAANVVPEGAVTPKLVDFSKSYDEDNNYATPSTADDDGVVIVAISAGYDHAVALDSNGTVWSWGNNGFGQLGNDAASYGAGTNKWDWTVDKYASGYGTTADNSLYASKQESNAYIARSAYDGSAIPVHVSRGSSTSGTSYRYLDHVVDISAGKYYTLALRSDGTVWAWGKNNVYQLGQETLIAGNGTRLNTTTGKGTQNDTLDRYAPVQVKGTDGDGSFLTGVTAISAGGEHALALTSDGSAYIWGRSYRTDNTRQYYYSTRSVSVYTKPTLVEGATNLKAISAGYEHDIAVDQNGQVWAWGDNAYGESGLNNTAVAANSNTAVAVLAGEGPSTVAGSNLGRLTNIISVAAGSNTALALSRDGYIYGWGYNGSGEVGNISTGDTSNNNGNSVLLPMLVGARAGNLLQITTATVSAADASVAEQNSAASTTRGKALYYAVAEDDAKTAQGYLYQGEMPVNLQLTKSQTVEVDTSAIVEEIYKGYNLHWEVTRRDVKTAVDEGEVASALEYADRFYAFSSDESVIVAERMTGGNGLSSGIRLTPTGKRHGTATIVIIDSVNSFWGSFTVTVYNEGLNEDHDPIVTLASTYTGRGTSYAIKQNGTVWAWGDNNNNNLALNGNDSGVTEEDNATPADYFLWDFFERETSSNPYLTNLIRNAGDTADTYNDRITAAIDNYNAAVTDLNTLDWTSVRNSFLAAVTEMRDQTATAVGTISTTVTTLEDFQNMAAGDSEAELFGEAISALRSLSDILTAKQDSYNGVFDTVTGLTGSAITADGFSKLAIDLGSLYNDLNNTLTGINVRLKDIWATLAENEDTSGNTIRDRFEGLASSNETYYAQAVAAMEQVDSLMAENSGLQKAYETIEDKNNGLTADKCNDFASAQRTVESMARALDEVKKEQAPYLADKEFYTAIQNELNKTTVNAEGKEIRSTLDFL